MSNERRQILSMLAEGKITPDEAEKLISAVENNTDRSKGSPETNGDTTLPNKKVKHLCIRVQPKAGGNAKDKVDIKVPIQIIRAGMKLGAILPGNAKDKVNDALKDKGINIDLNDLNNDALDNVCASLSELSIDVDDDKESVRIFCE